MGNSSFRALELDFYNLNKLVISKASKLGFSIDVMNYFSI